MAKRKIKLALSVYGVGGPGQHGLWRDSRVPKNASIDIDYYIALAKKAEAAKLDALFIVDSQFIDESYPPHYLNRLEPLTLLSAVAVHTRQLGLIATATSTYNSPFNLARRFASLDHISKGRAAWNVVTSFDVGASKNFGQELHLDYATRYDRALEHVRVVQGLWDSYEDDAFPADLERDVFLEPSKLHRLNHKGKHFSVAGPLNISRSRQGQPVIFQSGESEEGRNLAAQIAEGIYTGPGPLAAKQAYYADVKERTRSVGRNPDHLVILMHAGPVVADTDEQALALAREVYEADNQFHRKLAQFGRGFGGYDFSRHDLDAPFPDAGALAELGGRTASQKIIEHAREHKLSLRQTVEAFTKFQPSPFTGSPSTVAKAIEHWFEQRAFDGLNLGFRTSEDLDRFTDGVLPLLRARGLFRSEYESETLRGNLGLPFPENRYASHARRAHADDASASLHDRT
ncbi:MAG: NtaA/SnaA/SoxA family monooxygenase [Myxococcaceae bacterium]|nr:NtaA/SnaA/SoxA family monooxygenase [Myxococcaceae bacterium]